MSNESLVYSVDGLAARWMVRPDTVRRLIRAGKLRAFRVGKEYRVTDAAVREYEEGAA